MKTERTPAFLMANLGSEVARMYAARDANDSVRLEQSSARAFAILDSLLTHPALEGRTGEIIALREVLIDNELPEPQYHITKTQMESYFLPFATRVLS